MIYGNIGKILLNTSKYSTTLSLYLREYANAGVVNVHPYTNTPFTNTPKILYDFIDDIKKLRYRVSKTRLGQH